MKAEAVSLDSSETSLTLGEKVFNLLPETVRGKLSGRYNREEISRRVLQELGKGKRDDKSLHDGVVSALYLDENIPSSIKKSLLKHLGNMVPAQENETLKFFKQVNEKLGDQQASKGKTLGKSSVTEDFLKGEISQQNLTPVDTHRRDDNAIDREVRAIGVDMYPDHSERLEQKKYIARVRASKRSKKATAVDVPDVSRDNKNHSNAIEPTKESVGEEDVSNDASVFGGTDALPDDQKVSPPHEGEGYFGSPEYKQAIDDAAEENIKAEKGGIVPGGNPLESPFSNNGVEDKSETDFDYQTSLGDVPDMKMDMSGDSKDDLDKDDADFSLQGDVPDLERFEKSTLLDTKKEASTVASLEAARGETFDAAVSDDLKELYGKAIDVQKACDEAGRLYAEAQGREDSLRTKVYRIFPRLREKLTLELEGRKSLVDLEREYQKHLAELRQIKIDIANREAVKHGDAGKDIGKKMAEALIENNFRESVRMAELWAGEKRGDRRRMKVVRMAENAVEWYRKLDPKVKIAFSGALFVGTVVAGGVNWPLFVAALFLRMFGSAGLASAGRQLHERYALGRLGKGSDVERNQEWDEETLRQQANVPLEKFALYRKENQGRSRAWAGGGIALFLMGTGASYAGLARAAEHAADGENVAGAVQQALGTKPAGLSGSVPEVVANSGPTAGTVAKGAVETAAQMPGTGGLVPGAVVSKVLDHGATAEAAGKAVGNTVQEVLVGEHSSIEGAMKGMGTGGDIHRAYLEFLDRLKAQGEDVAKLDKLFQGKTFAGDKVYAGVGFDGKLHIFGIERESGGASLWKKFVKGAEEMVKNRVELGSQRDLGVHSFIEATSPRVSVPNISLSSLDSFPKIPEVNLESPQDIFERVLPKVPQTPSLEDTLSGNVPLDDSVSEHIPSASVPVSEVAAAPDQIVPSSEPLNVFDRHTGAAIAGAAMGGGALLGAESLRARRNARKKMMEEREIEDTRKRNSEFEATQKRANEVIDRVLSIVNFPNDRKEFLQEIRSRYGVYGDAHPSEEIFRDTMEKIAGVLFGSESVLQNEDILGNEFLAVAQRGVGDSENKNLAEIRTGIKNGYSVFQVLFGRAGERLPAGKITGLSVRDVLRLFTERFLTGKMPEELQGSSV